MTQSSATLMKGRLRENSNGNFNVDDNASDSTPPPGASRSFLFREASQKGGIDFLKDDKKEMTWGRRMALGLMDKKWYNPSAGREDGDEDAKELDSPGSPHSTQSALGDFDRRKSQKPSLEKAWAYFEHVALYRYIVEEKQKTKKGFVTRIIHKFQKGDKKFEKAEPGEKDDKTLLYDPIFTPHTQLGDFGLGLGLYFSTLRAITIITFILGLVSVYNINYFASDDYQSSKYRQEIPDLLQGSAICTMTSWVPCPTCNCTESGEGTRQSSRDTLRANRCGTASDPDSMQNLTFALHNDCDATPWQLGAVNYATVIMLLIATACLGEYLRRQEVKFDEDEQTAQDYSVRISNPPPDAKDPEEWHRFFEQNCDGAQVTVCTCAVDNDFLVRTLVERRERLVSIKNMLEPGTSMSNLSLAYIAAKQERERTWVGRSIAMLSPGVPEHYDRLVALNAKVQGFAQLEYPVTNVFLTFETEKSQRHVLEKLSVGSLSASKNDHNALSNPKYLFRGKHVLAVSEPDEPSTVRWQDLNAKFIQKLKEQALTVFATLGAIIAVAAVVFVANGASTVYAVLTISLFNSVFPIFAKALTALEAHAGEGEKQTSLYFKIALFRWVNTAIVITIITPFTDTLTLEDGLVGKIYALFYAEILTVSVIQLVDPMGHVNRHILAPRAKTQDAMNLMFQGAEFELAERYTDMTKLLFLCVWYCSIYPGAFFMCSFALLIKYFVDRFSLMRTWKRAPQLGTRVSEFSRRYFFSLACVAMAVISSFYWSGFPFDNICPNDGIDPAYVGKNFTVFPDTDSSHSVVSFDAKDVDYSFCNQDLLSPGGGRTFPFVAAMQPEGGEWMTGDQETVTTIFGWSAVAIIAIVILTFLWGWVEMSKGLFYSSYEAVGDDQNIPFSEVASRNAYIPQVISPLFSYPLIACDSDDIDPELYDWSDPERPFAFYDICKDAAKLLKGMEVQENVGFTLVRHFPPKQNKLLAANKSEEC